MNQRERIPLKFLSRVLQAVSQSLSQLANKPTNHDRSAIKCRSLGECEWWTACRRIHGRKRRLIDIHKISIKFGDLHPPSSSSPGNQLKGVERIEEKQPEIIPHLHIVWLSVCLFVTYNLSHLARGNYNIVSRRFAYINSDRTNQSVKCKIYRIWI